MPMTCVHLTGKHKDATLSPGMHVPRACELSRAYSRYCPDFRLFELNQLVLHLQEPAVFDMPDACPALCGFQSGLIE